MPNRYCLECEALLGSSHTCPRHNDSRYGGCEAGEECDPSSLYPQITDDERALIDQTQKLKGCESVTVTLCCGIPCGFGASIWKPQLSDIGTDVGNGQRVDLLGIVGIEPYSKTFTRWSWGRSRIVGVDLRSAVKLHLASGEVMLIKEERESQNGESLTIDDEAKAKDRSRARGNQLTAEFVEFLEQHQ